MGIFGKSKLNRSSQQSFVPPAGVYPVCPHCERAIEGVYVQQIKNEFGKTWIHFCRRCTKVLGVSQRKGFWMG